MNVGTVGREWEKLGQRDPMWAALTTPGKENSWTDTDFVEQGLREIDEVLKFVETVAEIKMRDKALDFGCGPGRLSLGLAQHFGDVIGIDISPSMIKEAKRLTAGTQNIELILNEKEKLSIFSNNMFDFIYTNYVLQHIPEKNSLEYIAEFGRVLRPGGLAVFFLPQARRKSNLKDYLRLLVPQSLEPVVYKMRFGDLPRMEMHGIDEQSVIDAASTYGLEIRASKPSENSANERWPNHLYVFQKA